MSYDLYFKSGTNSQSLTPEAFRAYFESRKHYTIKEFQAWYENQDTGVYFSFDYLSNTISSGAADMEDNELFEAVFNINYCRPHIFGLEAESEVAAFVNTFQLHIEDPQNNGMGNGPYSEDGFLKGWNTGNLYGYNAVFINKNPASLPHTLPAKAIEVYWHWNLNRADLQSKLVEDVFVPRIMFLKTDGKLFSYVVWGDGCAILLPVVDKVVIVRDKLAPSRFFRKRKDSVIISWEVLQVKTTAFPLISQGIAHKRLDYIIPPTNISDWISSLKPTPQQYESISMDQILDQEILSMACEQG